MSQADKFDTVELRSYHAWNERTPNQDLELFRKAADCIDDQMDEIERLREALQKVRPVIAADRKGLLDCHGINGKIPAEDELGTHGLYEYDGALHVIDAALSGESKC